MTNDPDLIDVWVDCEACSGLGSVADEAGYDVNCPECDGDGGWEQ